VPPGELRHGDWSEIDWDQAVWTIPAEKMKARRPHVVPLSRQVLALFRQLQAVSGGKGYIFPAFHTRRRPMSENTVNAAFRRIGFAKDEVTAHGLRSTASTLLNESGKWHPMPSNARSPTATATRSAASTIAATTGMSGCGWRSGGATTSMN
jgi:integrase